MEDLMHYGLHPIEIKQMNLKTQRYPGHANYIAYFKHEDAVTLQMVKSAKYLCHTRAKWDHYNPPTSSRERQCDSCWRMGHKSFGCHLTPRCLFCSSKEHTTKNCPLEIEREKLGRQRIPKKYLKCCNCGGQHTAMFKECPSRIAYNDKHNNKHKQQTIPAVIPQQLITPKNIKFSTAPIPSMNAWNQIGPQTTNSTTKTVDRTNQLINVNEPATRAPTTPLDHQITTPRRSRSTPRRNPPLSNRIIRKTNDNAQANPKQRRTVSSNLPNNNIDNNMNSHTTNSDLPPLRPDEMSHIFREMLSITSQCRTRVDQLDALMKLALKYLPCRD